MSDTSWRFYEIEKRVEELEAVVIKQRRSVVLLNARVFALFIALFIALLMVVI